MFAPQTGLVNGAQHLKRAIHQAKTRASNTNSESNNGHSIQQAETNSRVVLALDLDDVRVWHDSRLFAPY